MIIKDILLALERIEWRQQQILSKLQQPKSEGAPSAANTWLETGIDNILSFQVGKKGGEEE